MIVVEVCSRWQCKTSIIDNRYVAPNQVWHPLVKSAWNFYINQYKVFCDVLRTIKHIDWNRMYMIYRGRKIYKERFIWFSDVNSIYRDHTDCPVTGCSCKCLMIDSPIKPLGSWQKFCECVHSFILNEVTGIRNSHSDRLDCSVIFSVSEWTHKPFVNGSLFSAESLHELTWLCNWLLPYEPRLMVHQHLKLPGIHHFHVVSLSSVLNTRKEPRLWLMQCLAAIYTFSVHMYNTVVIWMGLK